MVVTPNHLHTAAHCWVTLRYIMALQKNNDHTNVTSKKVNSNPASPLLCGSDIARQLGGYYTYKGVMIMTN